MVTSNRERERERERGEGGRDLTIGLQVLQRLLEISFQI